MVQGLGLWSSNAKYGDSIPDWGAEILQARCVAKKILKSFWDTATDK